MSYRSIKNLLGLLPLLVRISLSLVAWGILGAMIRFRGLHHDGLLGTPQGDACRLKLLLEPMAKFSAHVPLLHGSRFGPNLEGNSAGGEIFNRQNVRGFQDFVLPFSRLGPLLLTSAP
jgi:hypothetical protein